VWSVDSVSVLVWTLTAAVEVVEPGHVVAAHLLGVAEVHVGVGDGDHGGLVVLGEGISAGGHGALEGTTHTQKHTETHTHMVTNSRAQVKPLVLTCGTA